MSKKEQSFIVSARKYRPESWDEVIGQESITETLAKSIASNHLAHAYLFCGPRGVGKTSCARIFAKEINRTEDSDGSEDFAFNIFELDAASNNGVDEIRNLTDQVRIPPQVGKYKVYIIDEVHMLSKQAFNAFLKTLEEPPNHAIFILATTEKHKIIPTILSRCQIYDFNRITVDEIVNQLKNIASQESIKYEEEALHVIGQKADGAMRDALSIFDQLASFTNQNLTYDAVLRNLHVLDYDYFFKISAQLLEKDYAEALMTLDEILSLGFDGEHFIEGLAGHFRDLLVCQNPKTVELLEVGQSVQAKYADQAHATPADWLLTALPIINEASYKYRNAPNHRLHLEVTLLNLCNTEGEKKNLNNQEKKVKEHASPALRRTSIAATDQKKSTTVPKTSDQTEFRTSNLGQPKEEKQSSETSKKAEPTPPSIIELKNKPIESKGSSQRKRRKTTVSLTLDENEGRSEDDIDATKSIKDIVENDAQLKSPELSLSEAWTTLCEESLENGKNALYSILVKQEINNQTDDNDVITVRLNHNVDQEEFSQHSADVLNQLRLLTGNKKLALTAKIETIETKSKLFRTQDKFDHFVNQNPSLKRLRQDLDLDFL
ncbi:MAG: DNA polymerase III subunit gamma/tau [Salibacteraceae bacterium]